MVNKDIYIYILIFLRKYVNRLEKYQTNSEFFLKLFLIQIQVKSQSCQKLAGRVLVLHKQWILSSCTTIFKP